MPNSRATKTKKALSSSSAKAKTKISLRLLVSALVLVITVAGAGAAMLLSQQQQDLRSDAENCPFYDRNCPQFSTSVQNTQSGDSALKGVAREIDRSKSDPKGATQGEDARNVRDVNTPLGAKRLFGNPDLDKDGDTKDQSNSVKKSTILAEVISDAVQQVGALLNRASDQNSGSGVSSDKDGSAQRASNQGSAGSIAMSGEDAGASSANSGSSGSTGGASSTTGSPANSGAAGTSVAGGQNPVGYHDFASCGRSVGWACDPDSYGATVAIHVYKNGRDYLGATTANMSCGAGSDCTVLSKTCGGNGNRRFAFTITPEMGVVAGDTVDAFAINIDAQGNKSGSNGWLTNQSQTYHMTGCQQ